jgi:hypothetical protein
LHSARQTVVLALDFDGDFLMHMVKESDGFKQLQDARNPAFA